MSVLLFRSLGGFKSHKFSSSVHFYTIQLLNGCLPIKSSSRPTGLLSAAWQPETYLTFVWWRWMPEAAVSPSLWLSPSPSGRSWVSVCALLDLHVWGTDESEGTTLVTDYFKHWLLHSVIHFECILWALAHVAYCVSSDDSMCFPTARGAVEVLASQPLLPSMGSTAVGI